MDSDESTKFIHEIALALREGTKAVECWIVAQYEMRLQ